MLFWNFLPRRNYFSCKFWLSKMLIRMFFRFLFSKSAPLVMKYRMLICHDQWKNRNVNMAYFPYNLFLKFSRLLSINSMNLEFRKNFVFKPFPLLPNFTTLFLTAAREEREKFERMQWSDIHSFECPFICFVMLRPWYINKLSFLAFYVKICVRAIYKLYFCRNRQTKSHSYPKEKFLAKRYKLNN